MNLKLVPIILKLKYPSPHKQKNKTKRVHVKSRVRFIFYQLAKIKMDYYNFGRSVENWAFLTQF